MTLTALLRGVRIQGTVVNLAAAGAANAVTIFALSASPLYGARSFRIVRIKVRNNIAGNCWVQIGTGVAGAFVDAIPPLWSLNGLNQDFVEGDLPMVQFLATMTAFPAALPGGGSLDIQVEVEEIG